MEIVDIQPQLYKQFSTILQHGKLSHAYLFSGGFGSFELAIWLSQALFCEILRILFLVGIVVLVVWLLNRNLPICTLLNQMDRR
ncbi:hypothetical protein QK908_03245 [Lactococcus cremoris]